MYFIFLLLICLLLLPSSSWSEKLFFLPKSLLIIPEESAVRIKWILTPESKEQAQRINSEKVKLVVDIKNEPVIVYENKLLVYPRSGYFIKLKEPVNDAICLDSGVMLFSNGEIFGYLEIEKTQEPFPRGKLKAIAKLPIKNSHIFKGDETVYVSGFNGRTKKYEIYIFNNRSRSFEKLLSLDKPVYSISGKGNDVYLANGNVVFEYKKSKINHIYSHPREEIKEIFYNEKVGLIYKTSNGIGIIKKDGALEFLQTENPLVFLKGTSLFVFFPSVSAVAELLNIDDLKNFSFSVLKIIDVHQTF